MTETWDDINKQVKADWKAETTPFERVYEIVEQTHDGQSAAEIADRALVSEPTARRHRKSLVNTGFAETDQDGQTTLYIGEIATDLMSRSVSCARKSLAELLDSIRDMKARSGTRRQLRRGVTGRTRPATDGDEAEGWDDLTAWRTTRQNLAVAYRTRLRRGQSPARCMRGTTAPAKARTDLSPGAPAIQDPGSNLSPLVDENVVR